MDWSENSDKDRKKDKDEDEDKYEGWKSMKKREEENHLRETNNKKWGIEKNLKINEIF